MAFDFPPNISQSLYFAAKERGYYAKECLDVSFLPPIDAATPAKLVGEGKRAQVGFIDSPEVIFSNAEGFPIISLFALWQDGEIGILTLSDVKSPKEFEGAKIGLLTRWDHVAFPEMVKTAGGDPSKVTTVTPTGFALVPPVVGKKLKGALASAFYELPECEETAGYGKCKLFLYSDFGVPKMQFVVGANRAWAEKHPDLAKAFVRASLRGLKYSIENPEKMSRLFVRLFPEESYNVTLAIRKRLLPTEEAPWTDQHGLGYQNLEIIDGVLKFLQAKGKVPDSITLEDIATNDYLPDPPIFVKK